MGEIDYFESVWGQFGVIWVSFGSFQFQNRSFQLISGHFHDILHNHPVSHSEKEVLTTFIDQICCEYSNDYSKVEKLKKILGQKFENLGANLGYEMKSVLRDNGICKNRKITKNDIIAAGIRNCRSPACHEHIIKNIKTVSESTATDWIHGIASASYDNKTVFAKSALNTLHKLLPGKSIFDGTG